MPTNSDKKTKVSPFYSLSWADRDNMLKSHGLSAVLTCMAGVLGHLRRSYLERQRLEIAWAVRLAERMAHDEKLFEEFCEDAVWKGVQAAPAAKDRQFAVKYLLRIMYGTDDKGTDKANRINRALKALSVEEAKSKNVAAAIKKRGGIGKLSKETAAAKRARGGSAKASGTTSDGEPVQASNTTPLRGSVIKRKAELTLVECPELLRVRQGDQIALYVVITKPTGKEIEMTVLHTYDADLYSVEELRELGVPSRTA